MPFYFLYIYCGQGRTKVMFIKEHPGKSYIDFIQPTHAFSFLILVLFLLDMNFSSFSVFSSLNLLTFGRINDGCHNCSLRFQELHEDTHCHTYKGEEQKNQFYLDGNWKKIHFCPAFYFQDVLFSLLLQRQCCLSSEFCDSLQNSLHVCNISNFFPLRFFFSFNIFRKKN